MKVHGVTVLQAVRFFILFITCSKIFTWSQTLSSEPTAEHLPVFFQTSHTLRHRLVSNSRSLVMVCLFAAQLPHRVMNHFQFHQSRNGYTRLIF